MRAGRAIRRDRGGLRTAVLTAAASVAAACVSVVDDTPAALVPDVPTEAVVIPLGAPASNSMLTTWRLAQLAQDHYQRLR